jgi:hypothetical protein
MSLPLTAAAATIPPLNTLEKNHWNNFLDYVDKMGYRGSSLLDNRDTGLGQKLMDSYRKVNPNFSLTYDRVADVQKDLQDYRTDMVDKYKKGQIQVEGVKSEADIMPDLSPTDGWLGSKTSSHKYPTARLTETNPQGTTVKDYGVNLAAYNAATANFKHQ